MSFQCIECARTFKTQFALTGHSQTHTKVTPVEIVNCVICSTKFDRIVRRANGQICRKETCSKQCTVRLRIDRCTESKKPDVVTKAKAVHGDKFDYSKTVYVDAKTPITVGCEIHGFFEIGYHSHIGSKYGCPQCGLGTRNEMLANIGRSRTMTVDTIMDRFEKTHGVRYQYPDIETEFNGIGWGFNKISIICVKHGIFKQHPSDHASGSGCPRCSKWVSNKERAWLDSLGLPDNSSHRQVWMGGYPVDGYDPKNNTIYFFHGSFWHGNPKVYASSDINPMLNKTYGELYERTMRIENELRAKGFVVISQWEH